MTKTKNFLWKYSIGDRVWYADNDPTDCGTVTDRMVDDQQYDSYQVLWDLDKTTDWYYPGQLTS